MIRSHVLSVLKGASSQVSYHIELSYHEHIFHSRLQYIHALMHITPLCIMFTVLHQVQAAIRSSGGSKASVSEGVEASVIYVRFKAAASEVTVNPFGLE